MTHTEFTLLEHSIREGACLRWTRSKNNAGYGQIRINTVLLFVHRVAYELWVGPIPTGFDVDHVYSRGCRYTDCIEPTHLEAVTHQENILRRKRRITHCPHGHEYSTETTVIRISASGGSARQCRTCHNLHQKAWRERNKAIAKKLAE